MASKHPNHKSRGLGASSIGAHKHATSGKTPKSPKLRHKLMLEAQRNERKAPQPLPYDSVDKVFKDIK